MMRSACCLILMYWAAVSQVMIGDETWSVNWSAVTVAWAVTCFPPAKAASLAFLMGLWLDGLATGPLGVRAATLVVLAGVLTRWGFAAGPRSAWQWMRAVFLTSWWLAAICTAVEFVPGQRWEDMERTLMSHTLTAGVTALAVGLLVGGWRQWTGTPCTTH